MWFLYVPLVVLALVGVGGLAFGILPLGIICLVIAGASGSSPWADARAACA